MASLSGVSSSNMTSSLYNSANIISGLASGLDTEGMIESLVQSYQTKINQLSQKVTKTEWKQDAYRSIITKMVGFGSKYTSYTSATNLLSPSFFSSAVKVSTLGTFADKVAASGKTNSDISLNSVKQLATSAQYRTRSNLKSGDGKSIEADSGIDLVDGTTELGRLNGSLGLTYGSKSVTIQFDEVADVKALKEIQERNPDMGNDEALAKLIEQKLADQNITLTGGVTYSADKRINVEVKNGKISFSDKSSAGNSVYISQASGNVASTLGLNLDNANEDKPDSFTLSSTMKSGLTKQEKNSTYFSGKTMNLSLDGTNKKITMPIIYNGTLYNSEGDAYLDEDGNPLAFNADNYAKALNEEVQKAFKGSKITVSNAATDGNLKLRFDVQEGSNLIINSDVGEGLGIGRTATSYLNANKTLEDLLGKDKLSTLTPARVKDKDGKWVDDIDEKTGEPKYEFKINGVVVGNYSKDATLADIMADINGNSAAGVKVSYSQTTKNFLFTSKETGADSEIELGDGLASMMFDTVGGGASTNNGNFADMYGLDWLEDGESETVKFDFGSFDLTLDIAKEDSIEDVAEKLNKTISNNGYTASYNERSGQLMITDKTDVAVNFNMTDSWGDSVEFDGDLSVSSYTPGQDAVFNVTVNGETMDMVRSSNTVDIDGLKITMKDTFDGYKNADGTPAVDSTGKAANAVTFKSTVDADKIVDAVKSMIEDYNAMMAEIKSAYGTMPYQKTDGTFANYEPLTDDDRAGMSESAIERYEEKAKQGILFGDRTLSGLYDKLRNVFSPAGEDGAFLRAMGITTSYSISDGTQAVTLDENKLRDMLENDPDRVADVFTKSGGVMDSMKVQLDNYSKTTGEPKGILIQQAGSPLSSLSLMNNTWQKEIDNINTEIQKWQDKLSAQVDRYTQQFSRLEVLINQMNSQSSTLAGLMGG